MPFTDYDKHFIKILHKEKNYSYRKFITKYPIKNWNRRGLCYLIKKTDESYLRNNFYNCESQCETANCMSLMNNDIDAQQIG